MYCICCLIESGTFFTMKDQTPYKLDHTSFSSVPLESQSHPGITPATPFEILIEKGHGPQKELKGDVHYCLQFSVVLAGSVEVSFGNWKKVFTRDQIWWTMCWEPHAFRLLSPRNIILSVNINIDSVGSIGPCCAIDWLLPFTVALPDRFCPEKNEEKLFVRQWAKEIYMRNHSGKVPDKIQCWLLIHQMLLHAFEIVKDKAAVDPVHSSLNSEMSRIQKAVQLVRTSRIPPPLTEAAAQCSLSVSRFSVLFSSVMGVSYGKFALRVRLSHAANEVRSGLYTLNEIAERYGFCDGSSFCNAFKKVYNCTPHEFQNHPS